MNHINQILTLMEDIPTQGMLDAPEAMDMMPGDLSIDNYSDEDCCGVSPEVLDLAKQLITQAGSAEKAREIVDKVEEVMDLLDGVVQGGGESDIISRFADSMPDEPGLPNNRHNMFGMSSAYNPSELR